ncbi:hypothetical protein PRIPAC_97896, partial [Pristionchus pacificus]|uniref:Uncharacterized protein n=1 Tax=Pristionchus pacificus TaxID=54126 RepID=A0A2A6D1Z3_PRIPA
RLCKNRTNSEGSGTVKKGRIYETLDFGVLKGADDDGYIDFAQKVFVGSRRRHVENRFCRISRQRKSLKLDSSRHADPIYRFPWPRYSTKPVFDVTSSGANEDFLSKINIPIVISTLQNPEIQSFINSTYFYCAGPCPTLRRTGSYIADTSISLGLILP